MALENINRCRSIKYKIIQSWGLSLLSLSSSSSLSSSLSSLSSPSFSPCSFPLRPPHGTWDWPWGQLSPPNCLKEVTAGASWVETQWGGTVQYFSDERLHSNPIMSSCTCSVDIKFLIFPKSPEFPTLGGARAPPCPRTHDTSGWLCHEPLIKSWLMWAILF